MSVSKPLRWAPHSVLPNEPDLREAAKNPADVVTFAKYFGGRRAEVEDAPRASKAVPS